MHTDKLCFLWYGIALVFRSLKWVDGIISSDTLAVNKLFWENIAVTMYCTVLELQNSYVQNVWSINAGNQYAYKIFVQDGFRLYYIRN